MAPPILAAKTEPWMLELDPIVAAAFPEGPTDRDYWPLVTIFAAAMSFHAEAGYLARWFDKPSAIIYHDVIKVVSRPDCSPDDLAQVEKKLDAAGYQDWFRSNEI